MVPEAGGVPSAVRVPICISPIGSGVQIKDISVNAAFGADVDHPIKVLEPLFVENSGVLMV